MVSASWRLTCAISETGRKAATEIRMKSGTSAGSSAPPAASCAPSSAIARPPSPVASSRRSDLARQIVEQREPQLPGSAARAAMNIVAPAIAGAESEQLGHALDGFGDVRARARPGRRARARRACPRGCRRSERRGAGVGEERRQRERERPRRGGEPRQHRARHQHGDDRRRDRVGEEVLDRFDVLGRERDQVAGAALEQIGGRERFEPGEERDAHLGEQAVGHVVREPRFEPVQQPGERRDDQQRDHERLRKAAALDSGDRPARRARRRR